MSSIRMSGRLLRGLSDCLRSDLTSGSGASGPASGSLLLLRTGSPGNEKLGAGYRCLYMLGPSLLYGDLPVKGFVLNWVGSYRSNPSAASSGVGSVSPGGLGGDLPLFPPLGPLELGPEGWSVERMSGMRSPSSVTACVPKEMLFPRLRRVACSKAISAVRWSALPSENARHETPPPCCGLGLSTLFISTDRFRSWWKRGPRASRSES
jgi:hypothetical protein